MDQDRENLPADDIMLSSAEDLNTDGGFMGGESVEMGPMKRNDEQPQEEDEPFDVSDAEFNLPEEPEANFGVDEGENEEIKVRKISIDAPEEEEESASDDAQEMSDLMDEEEREEAEAIADLERIGRELKEDEQRGSRKDRHKFHKNVSKDYHLEMPKKSEYGARIISTKKCHECKINKLALVWMIILTIILTGVIGMMVYAFIVNQSANSQPEEPQEEVESILVSGSLEVYLNDVDLNNYDSNITLVNKGGVINLTGTLKHTVYVSTSSAVTLALNNVDIEAAGGAAIVNLTGNDMVLRTQGANHVTGAGSTKYPAAIYSTGPMTIAGKGSLSVYATGERMAAIKTEKGYRITGSDMRALGRTNMELPLTENDSQTQAYFAKNLARSFAPDLKIVASDGKGKLVASFVSEGPFSSLLVSNALVQDGVEYTIQIGEEDDD